MTRYVMPNKQRMLLIGGMGLGLLCLVLSWFSGDTYHTRFWTNFLHNSVFFTGIAFMAIFFYAVCTTAWGGWFIIFKRVWESMSMFLGVGVILIGIITLTTVFDMNHLYHWADSASVGNDDILEHKSSFLNNFWFLICLLVVVVWFFFAQRIRMNSIKEDDSHDRDYKIHFKNRYWTALFLPIAGFTSSLVLWQWVMSIDAHWYSTLFAWYSGASLFVSMIGLTIMILVFLKSQGYYPNLTLEHFHDLGKFLFAFSIFWTYLWFSQYMLIWYANVGEETIYFKIRQTDYPVLFYANLAINFLIPFFILMRNDTKRKYGTLIFVSIVTFFGHWLDFFLMIKPGALHTVHELSGHHGGGHGESHHAEAAHGVAEAAGHHTAEHTAHAASTFEAGFTLPGFLEIGTMIGFLCLFLYVFYMVFSKSNLVPKNDPYLAESLHHHT